MPDPHLPLLIEPEELEIRLGTQGILVVDLCTQQVYAHAHIPGAVHLEYDAIVAGRPPVGGLLPDARQLSQVFSSIALTPETHVVAYDDEGGGKAGRLLWTLDVIGHTCFSLLNGGIHAWTNEGYPLDSSVPRPAPADYSATIGPDCHASKDYIMQKLGNPDVVLLDTRTPEEFSGLKRFAIRGGHIPGAVNMDWVLPMDQQRNLRLKPEGEVRDMLEGLGVSPEREVIVYCQTHHRSSHTYMVLKSLGYPRVRGYPGAWSEWGNLRDTPVE